MATLTSEDIADAVRDVGVAPGDVLCVHSGMQGALRAAGDTREAKMDTVLDGLEAATATGVLALPAFTYSFTRGEVFDVERSPSSVGMLTERFRQRPHVERTRDPLFSFGVSGAPGDWASLFAVGDVDCFGEQSIFARLHEADAKLLFFSVPFDTCTFVHLVEQRLRMPYRYFKAFAGDVVDAGATTRVTATYFVRDLAIESDFTALAAALKERGLLREARIPNGPQLLCCRARDVHDVATECVREQPTFLVDAP